MAEVDNVQSNKATTSYSQSQKPEYITVTPFIRYANHAFAGITESPKVAVKFNKTTREAEYEPTKLWLKRSATALLFALTASTIWYRRKRLEMVGGLVSLTGASRPVLSGAAWATGITGVLNCRPIKSE
ncbi:hypothetical protein GGI25_006166 [Coemansia spiralis]|uniref:Uncharacterized protein n=2 Tax=Coemansia TaxID=4863 RepID=A0A9W8KV32_9FUNG|nr:hypothetical protein EDC05_006142 [Coemansia umbellata]KAJ2618881.1 hypothetical protein GGI26_006264 [Coemansia sp. RSA 1358]KAJ2669395.1 hypothetical protein GGI25_006166 [Coemansia spiralis]